MNRSYSKIRHITQSNILLEQRRNLLKEDTETAEDGYHYIYKRFESQINGKGHPVVFADSNVKRWVMTWNFVDGGMFPDDGQKWAAEIKPVLDPEPKGIKRVGPKIASQALLVIYLPNKPESTKKWDKIVRMIKPYTKPMDLSGHGYQYKTFMLDKSTAGNGVEVISQLSKGII